jgi:hypothetical protein
VGLVQEHAELALLVLQPLDQRDRVVRRAAHPVAVLDKPFERVLPGRHDKARLVVVEIAEIAIEAPACVLEGLFAGLGDMHRAHETQPRRVHLPPVLSRDIAGDLPVGGQRVIAERVGGGDADHAEIVSAGEPAARRGHRADHCNLGIWLGVGQ